MLSEFEKLGGRPADETSTETLRERTPEELREVLAACGALAASMETEIHSYIVPALPQTRFGNGLPAWYRRPAS